MYQALYRKWRPKTFDDVVGQEHVTRTLAHEVADGKLTHAYLFTGSRGTGKTTCAKIFAKAVNCLHPRDGNPCLECEVCLGIEQGRILDVVEQDAASNNGVDAVRTLKEETNFTPVSTHYRVYILDEVHMLSISAVNALLKIMEEPPPHVIFILATTEVHKIPETLLSRCQRFDFKRLPAERIAERLQQIATAEQAALQPEAAMRIAYLSNGGMRDAISLLDQALAVTHEVDAQAVDYVAGVVDRAHLYQLTDAIRAGDTARLMELVDELYQRSFDLDQLCGDLHSHFRDLMLAKTCKDLPRYVSCTPQELAELQAQSEGLTLATVLHAMNALQDTQLRISRSASARPELEMCLLRLADTRLDVSPEALLRRIEQLEERLRNDAPPTAAPLPPVSSGPDPAAPPAVAPKTTAEPGPAEDPLPEAPPDEPPAPEPPRKIDRPKARRPAPAAAPSTDDPSSEPLPAGIWSEVLATLAKTNPALAGALTGSTAYCTGDLMLIDGSAMFLNLIRGDGTAKESLREAIRAQTGKNYRLGPYKKKEPESPVDRFARMEQKAREMGIEIDNV